MKKLHLEAELKGIFILQSLTRRTGSHKKLSTLDLDFNYMSSSTKNKDSKNKKTFGKEKNQNLPVERFESQLKRSMYISNQDIPIKKDTKGKPGKKQKFEEYEYQKQPSPERADPNKFTVDLSDQNEIIKRKKIDKIIYKDCVYGEKNLVKYNKGAENHHLSNYNQKSMQDQENRVSYLKM